MRWIGGKPYKKENGVYVPYKQMRKPEKGELVYDLSIVDYLTSLKGDCVLENRFPFLEYDNQKNVLPIESLVFLKVYDKPRVMRETFTRDELNYIRISSCYAGMIKLPVSNEDTESMIFNSPTWLFL